MLDCKNGEGREARNEEEKHILFRGEEIKSSFPWQKHPDALQGQTQELLVFSAGHQDLGGMRER